MKIKPIKLPRHLKIRPISVEDARFENSTDGEKMLFDLIAQEHTGISGTTIEYYRMDRDSTEVDPLYGEATEKMWVGPYRMKGHLEWPDPRPENREEGFRTTQISMAWIARQEFEEVGLEWPHRGDIIRVWKIPYFDEAGNNNENTPDAGYYFNVVDVKNDGHMLDNPDFSGFKMELRRYSEFNPERRIYAPKAKPDLIATTVYEQHLIDGATLILWQLNDQDPNLAIDLAGNFSIS